MTRASTNDLDSTVSTHARSKQAQPRQSSLGFTRAVSLAPSTWAQASTRDLGLHCKKTAARKLAPCVSQRTCFHLQAEVFHHLLIRASGVAEAHVLKPQLTHTLGRLLTRGVLCKVTRQQTQQRHTNMLCTHAPCTRAPYPLLCHLTT